MNQDLHEITNFGGHKILKKAHLVKDLISQILCIFSVLQQQISTKGHKVPLDVEINKEIVDDSITQYHCPVINKNILILCDVGI